MMTIAIMIGALHSMRYISFLCLSLFTAILTTSCSNREQKKTDQSEDRGAGNISVDVSYLQTDPATPFAALANENFIPVENQVLNFSFTDRAVWLKIGIVNSRVSKAFLIIDNPHVIAAEAFKISNGFYQTEKVIDQDTRLMVPLDTGKHSLVIKLQSNESLILPIALADEVQIINDSSSSDVWQGLYLGVLITIMLYNIFLFITLSEKTYLYYAIYALSMALSFCHITGYMSRVLPEGAMWLNNFPVLVTSACLSLTAFAFRFLDFPFRWIRAGVSLVLIFIAGTAVVLDFLNMALLANQVVDLLGFCTAISLFLCGAYSLFVLNFKPARFYLIAFTIFHAGAVVFVLKDFGILPINALTRNAAQIGNLIEVILLSIALADKIAIIRAERERSKERKKTQIQQHKDFVESRNVKLQQAVDERTAELKKANAMKDKFFSIVSHDLRDPLLMLARHTDEYKKKIENNANSRDAQLLAARLNNAVQRTISLTDNLLAWAKSQMALEALHPKKINLSGHIRNTIEELHQYALWKEVKITNSVIDLDIWFDENDLKFITRNLLSNAIKFSTPGSHILVSANQYSSRLSLSFTDHGVGIAEDQITSIFVLDPSRRQKGTGGEEGTGLGLILCKEFAERNGAEIIIQSNHKSGTVAILEIPLIVQPGEKKLEAPSMSGQVKYAI
jgi:two-component system, sensor histidine kinase LadS